jgi:hypothetical protein
MNYSEEEKEVIDKIETLYKYLNVWKENYTIVPKDKRYFKTILNLIQKQSKIIDKMAEQLTTPVNSKEWIIEFYKKEVEKDEERT